MTRIIAGSAGGRRIAVPAAGTRPTSDRVRESLFASLDSALAREGRAWEGLRVADLFAGSGALGLEAASRGAGEVSLVERGRAALAVLRRNVDDLALPGTHVIAADALGWCSRATGPFDLVLADPPYDLDAEVLADALASLPLAPGAIVVVERRSGGRCPMPGRWAPNERRYGDTALWYGREAGPTGGSLGSEA